MENDFISEETLFNLVKEVMEFTVNPSEFAAGEKKYITVVLTKTQPATWWQHFKQENFPAWALRAFPVKYTFQTETRTVEFDRTFVFPEA